MLFWVLYNICISLITFRNFVPVSMRAGLLPDTRLQLDLPGLNEGLDLTTASLNFLLLFRFQDFFLVRSSSSSSFCSGKI